jgi:hypothetical protein
MSTATTKLGLTKPAAGEKYSVTIVNTNADLIDAIALAIYPVGAIYMSVVNTSPATLFGGTWSAWGAGRVAVGVDTGITEFNTVEKTGGEATHALSVAELAEHNHTYPYDSSSAGTLYGNAGALIASKAGDIGTSYAGNGTAHNNLQPYITCYMWKRTA